MLIASSPKIKKQKQTDPKEHLCDIKHQKRRVTTVPSGPPVYAGLGVSDFVEARDLKAVGVASLALVHEVAEGQHHLQDLSQPLAPDHLLGCVQDGWWEAEREAAAEMNDVCAFC